MINAVKRVRSNSMVKGTFKAVVEFENGLVIQFISNSKEGLIAQINNFTTK